MTLPRLAAVAALDDAAETQRFIVVRGDTGVGKSWVLRHYSERVAARAPIIVLDREATPPGGWLYLANALGIPGSADALPSRRPTGRCDPRTRLPFSVMISGPPACGKSAIYAYSRRVSPRSTGHHDVVSAGRQDRSSA